jgi:hypothetical protein
MIVWLPLLSVIYSICVSFEPIYVCFESFKCIIVIWLIYSYFIEHFVWNFLYGT